MTILQSSIAPPSGGYQIERSLRFNSADSAYLNWTPASAATNSGIWTISFWCKRSTLGTLQRVIATSPNSGSNVTEISFQTDNTLYCQIATSAGGGASRYMQTTQVFRDVSAWMHFVLAFDRNQATASNRLRLYVNGTEVTAFSTDQRSSIANTDNSGWNTQSIAQYIGRAWTAANYIDCYLTEFYSIDGQQLTPSSFGQSDPNTGVWSPIKYTGTYGTNGFYLNFSDNSNTTSTTLGKDSSGNGNNWTPSGFSVAAGAGNDSLVDTPTSYGTDTGVGGEVRGNYCTLTPLINVPAGTISNGNLDYNRGSTASHGSAAASFTLPTTGKWYWEVRACKSTNNEMIGVANIQNNPQLPATGSEIGTGSRGDYGYRSDGNKYNNGSQGSYGATYTSGDTIGVAWDSDAGTLVFYKNGTSQGTAFSSITQAEGKFAPAVSSAETSPDSFNFGQRPFANTAPSGYKALCTQNLPPVTIGATSTTQANDYFNTVLYTGTGSSQSITGVGFQPDFVWIKERNGAADHGLYDAVRGVQKQLESNSNGQESTETTGLTAFGTDGFTVGALAQLNTNTDTYVAWNWNAGGSNATNTSGTITSTVRANTTAGFSIVTYTGNGVDGATVGHGLGVTPAMVIQKRRDGNIGGWRVWHTAIYGTSGVTDTLILNTSAASGADADNISGVSSTTFTTRGTGATNPNGNNCVAYVFAEVAGYSAFGKYTGNGDANGPFIYTGFRPRYVMFKSTGVQDWMIIDGVRDPYNVAGSALWPDLDYLENYSSTPANSSNVDFLSNGFKLRNPASGSGYNNGSSVTYIYAAFAESPFKYSLAR